MGWVYINDLKFIVDHNAGKLVKRLRLIGYDAVFFNGIDDADMIVIALTERRVILTRDTQIMKRGVITSGRVKAILIEGDRPEDQMCQVIKTLGIETGHRPFSVCLECNEVLREIGKEAVRDRLPPYVFKTQEQYMECPKCQRVYWRGTHWQRMNKSLKELVQHCKQDRK